MGRAIEENVRGRMRTQKNKEMYTWILAREKDDDGFAPAEDANFRFGKIYNIKRHFRMQCCLNQFYRSFNQYAF